MLKKEKKNRKEKEQNKKKIVIKILTISFVIAKFTKFP